MCGARVVRLTEVDRRKFPVGVEANLAREDPYCRLHRIVFVYLGQRVQILHQPRAVIAKAIPDETTPCITPELFEPKLAARVSLRKVFWVVHRLQNTIDSPHPAMIATVKVTD